MAELGTRCSVVFRRAREFRRIRPVKYRIFPTTVASVRLILEIVVTTVTKSMNGTGDTRVREVPTKGRPSVI